MGVYEPAQYNDRLLLGLKGTMSEAELHILKQRMNQGKLNKARRGELLVGAPIGYLLRPTGEVTPDPDEQAQEVVRLIFRKFDELGTLNALLQFMAKNGVKLPVRARQRSRKGELEWHRPRRMTLHHMLTNPFYAGAYAYGQRAVDPRRKIPGRPGTGRTVVPLEQCRVFLKDRFPAYISWQQYQLNQERLKANRNASDAIGAPKNGQALLAGLVVCGKCGCRMGVRYNGQRMRHSYICTRRHTEFGEPLCQSLAGSPLDLLVSQQVLNALQPASLELSLEAAEHIELQRQELDGLWQKRLERARYDAERAARQYAHVEPEDRLVARQLERHWEEKLQHQTRLGEEYARFLSEQPRLLTSQERQAIRELASDIPALWDSPSTTAVDRKQILRQLIDQVVVEVVGQSECVKLTIKWAGGTETHHLMARPVANVKQLGYWPQLVERLQELASENLSTDEIAQRLNSEGWQPPKQGAKFMPCGVKELLYRLGFRERQRKPGIRETLGEDEWWLQDLATKLGMPHVSLYAWLRRGLVKGRRSKDGCWILQADVDEVERLRQLRALPKVQRMHRRRTDQYPVPVRN